MRPHRTPVLGIFPLALSLAVAMCAAGDAGAKPPQPAEGVFSVEAMELVSLQPAGDICMLEVRAAFELEGDFEGVLSADFLILHFGPCDQPAPEIFVAQGTFTGAVDGAAGSFDFTFVGDIDASGNADGDLVIRRGTAELTKLAGKIRLVGVTGVGGVYGGRIHVAP